MKPEPSNLAANPEPPTASVNGSAAWLETAKRLLQQVKEHRARMNTLRSRGIQAHSVFVCSEDDIELLAAWVVQQNTSLAAPLGSAKISWASSDLLVAVAEVLKALDHFEQNVPQTPAWMKDENKCEVSLGALRRLKEAAND